MTEILWNKLLEASPALGLALVSWIAVQVQRVLNQLRTLNGRMTKSEGNQAAHDILDNARFEALQREIVLTDSHGSERRRPL